MLKVTQRSKKIFSVTNSLTVSQGICQSCRGRLCDDKPFDCNQAQVTGNWACQSCHENGTESTCHFPAKPTKAEKAAWNSFQLVNGKTSRSSQGGHLKPSEETPDQAAVAETEQPKAAESLAPRKLWVTLKCDQVKASLHAAQVASTTATDRSSNNGDWSTAVNRPPTPPDSVGDFMEIGNKSRKNSTIESPVTTTLQLIAASSRRGPESDLEINSDSADTLANPRKRRRLQRGLRDREDFSPAGEYQPSTLKPSRSGSLPNHNDEELLKKFTETAKRRASANGKLLPPTMEVFARSLDAEVQKIDSSSINGPKSQEPIREAGTADVEQSEPEDEVDLVMLDTPPSKHISNAELAPALEPQVEPSKLEQPVTESSKDDAQSQTAKQSEVSLEAASGANRDDITLDVDMNYNLSREPSSSTSQSRSNQVSQIEPQTIEAQPQHQASNEGGDDVQREASIDRGGTTPDNGVSLASNPSTDKDASRPEEDSGVLLRQETFSSSAVPQHSIRQIGESASEAQLNRWHVSINPFRQEEATPLTHSMSPTNMLLAEALSPPPQHTQPDISSLSRLSLQTSAVQSPPQDLPPKSAVEEANNSRPTSSGGKPKPDNTYIEDMLRGSRKNSFAPAPIGQSPTSPVSRFSTQESETRPTSGWTAINASQPNRKSDAVPDIPQTSGRQNSGGAGPSKKRSFKGPDLSELKVLAPAPTSPASSTGPRNANNPRNRRHPSASRSRASSQASLPQQTPAVQQSPAVVQAFSPQQPAALPHTSTPPPTLSPQDVQAAASPNHNRHSSVQLLTQPHEPGPSAHSEELQERSNQGSSRVHIPPANSPQRLEGFNQMPGPNRSPQVTTRMEGNPNPGPAGRYPWVQTSRAGSPLRHSLSAHAHPTGAHAAMPPNQQAYRHHDAHSQSANVSPTTNLPQLEHDTIFQQYPMEVPAPLVRVNGPFAAHYVRRGSAPTHNPAVVPDFPQPTHQTTGQENVSAQGPHGHPSPAHKSNMQSAYPFLQHQRKPSSQEQRPPMPSQVYSRHAAEEEATRRACGPGNVQDNVQDNTLFYNNPFDSPTQHARKHSQPDVAAAAINPVNEPPQPKPAKKPRKPAARKSQPRQEKEAPPPASKGAPEPIPTAPLPQPSFSLDQTKIRLYVRPSPAYEPMRLGPAKTCGEFVDTILIGIAAVGCGVVSEGLKG